MPADTLSFVTARTVEEALDEIAGREATVLGGGSSVGLLMGQGLLDPSKLVLVTLIPELRAIAVDPPGRLRIGAAVTLRELAAHPEVRATLPALARAASLVGNPRVRSVATVGGALAHADPRQDVPPALIALGAEATIAGPAGTRTVPAATFATGFMETVLSPDELVTEVSVPLVAGQRSHYARFTPGSATDYPTVGVAAAVTYEGDGPVSGAAVSIGGAGSTPSLVDASALVGTRPARDRAGARSAIEEVARRAARSIAPTDDRRGSVDYKRAMTRVWTERALLACIPGI